MVPRPLFSIGSPVLVLVLLLTPCHAQAPRANGGGNGLLNPIDPGDDRFEAREKVKCSRHFRTFDGTCTNRWRKLWGAAGRPQYTYFRHQTSVDPTGTALPSARYISNVICKQAGDRFNRRGMSEMVTFFGQFLDHTIVATPVDTSSPMHIPIPSDDPIFANFSGELPFERSVRGQVERRMSDERPINSLSSAIDLASVYGSDNLRIRALREFTGGKLKSSEGDMLPINTEGLRNAPTKEASFFLAGDHRANEHPVLTSLHTLFLREHNRLCDELKAYFSDWSDDELFNMARAVNIAQFQKIVYAEFLPAIMGRPLHPYRGYVPWVDLTISDVFSTAAFRIGHTLVGNGINRRGKGMSEMPKMQMAEMFFRAREVMKDGIEPFLRGAMYNPAQEVDIFVHDALRNFLFTKIPQEKGFDLIALNLQRGRDHAIPSFNELRRLVRIRPARRFSHITRDRTVQGLLATAYGSPDKVEAWIGLMAEDHVRGASMGKTMTRLWALEFSRLRDGDRFFYKRYGLFPVRVWRALPQLRRMLYGQETLREVILRNSDITGEEIGASVWGARLREAKDSKRSEEEGEDSDNDGRESEGDSDGDRED